MRRILLVFNIMLFGVIKCLAHPMPNSIVLMDVGSKSVAVELQLPLGELQLAFGHDVATNSVNLIARMGADLKAYLIQHVKPLSEDGRPWTVKVTDMTVGKSEQTDTGPYQELVAHLLMQPPAGASLRNFTLNYDVIIHQVVTHSALLSVRQDWEAGVNGERPVEVGAISLDIRNNVIHPVTINLSEGSKWKGFKSMVELGISHIADGTDHLMFLLVLLLPAPLLVSHKSWKGYGGARYSVIRLLKIVTAFTIGHSITLLLGTLGWIKLPDQLVEILIAFSILISAIHAIRPVFPGKEVYIASAFGLIHGLAFAGTLTNLHLDAGPMIISILGFNVGIELMQLLVIVITMPWLILLSKGSFYTAIRLGGAIFAAIAAIAWMFQRCLEKQNVLTSLVENIARHAIWIIVGIAVLALLSWVIGTRKIIKI